MSEVQSKRDIRRHTRKQPDVRVRMTWQDLRGEPRTCEVACLDISESGLRVTVPEAVPVRSTVHLRGVNASLETAGSVRYCRRHGLSYLVGVEFSGGFTFAAAKKTARWD